DVRTRIDVLSEVPVGWAAALERWRQFNPPRAPTGTPAVVPDPETELLLYQTLVGAWPQADADVPGFRDRLQAYLVKASREAKRDTSWRYPDAEYEQTLREFVDSLFDAVGARRFLDDFKGFQQPIAYYGALNSLTQVLLKIAAPGVPDFYQGTELW